MKRRLALVAFCLVAVLQISVPAYLILRYENVLHRGTLHRFRARPVDPYDSFRGRYVMLSVDGATTTTLTGDQKLETGDWVYASLVRDADGFSKFAGVTTEKPDSTDYVRTRVQYVSDKIWESNAADGTTTKSWSGHYIESKVPIVTLEVPFDRYYMEESVAPRAESVYRTHSLRRTGDAEVLVRVLQGDTVVEDLVVAGRPIREYLRENPEPAEPNHP